MKLQEAKDTFYEASDTLSENVRKLFFAGIAVVWIFRVTSGNAAAVELPRELLVPLGVFVLGLVLDLAQYLYKSTVWWIYYSFKNRGALSDDEEINAPSKINVLTFVFFYSKIGCCAFGYYRLLKYLWSAIDQLH